MIFYYDKNGRVCMYSDNKADCQVNFLEYSPTQDDIDKIKSGYDIMVTDGSVQFIETEGIKKLKKDKELKETREQLIEAAKTKKLTNEELLNFILQQWPST